MCRSDNPSTRWLHKSISQVSVFPLAMPSDILAPTCQSASFTGSFFLIDFPHFQLSHSLARAHGRLLQLEWKPQVWPGPVAHISHFCKPCHSVGRRSRLEVCPSLYFFSVCSFLAQHCRRSSCSDGPDSRGKQTQAKLLSLVKCLKRKHFKHGWGCVLYMQSETVICQSTSLTLETWLTNNLELQRVKFLAVS